MSATDWLVLPNIGVGVGVGVGGRPSRGETAGLVEGWEDSSNGTSYHSKAAATVVTTATSQTKKHTNVTPEGRRMAEQRDMDELVDEFFTPSTQMEILSELLINPAKAYGYFLSVVIRRGRAILVRYHGNNNWTDQEVAEAIVRSIRARHNRVPPEIRLPALADGPTDLSSVSIQTAPPLADHAANADIPHHQGPDLDSFSLSTAGSFNSSIHPSLFDSSALSRQSADSIALLSRQSIAVVSGGSDPIVPPIAEEYVDSYTGLPGHNNNIPPAAARVASMPARRVGNISSDGSSTPEKRVNSNKRYGVKQGTGKKKQRPGPKDDQDKNEEDDEDDGDDDDVSEDRKPAAK
jgi:hypothetical protein